MTLTLHAQKGEASKRFRPRITSAITNTPPPPPLLSLGFGFSPSLSLSLSLSIQRRFSLDQTPLPPTFFFSVLLLYSTSTTACNANLLSSRNNLNPSPLLLLLLVPELSMMMARRSCARWMQHHPSSTARQTDTLPTETHHTLIRWSPQRSRTLVCASERLRRMFDSATQETTKRGKPKVSQGTWMASSH